MSGASLQDRMHSARTDLTQCHEDMQESHRLISSFCFSSSGNLPAFDDDLDDGFETEESIVDDDSDCESTGQSPRRAPEFFSISSPCESPKSSQIFPSKEGSPLQSSAAQQEETWFFSMSSPNSPRKLPSNEGSQPQSSRVHEEEELSPTTAMADSHTLISSADLHSIQNAVAELRSEVAMLKKRCETREEGTLLTSTKESQEMRSEQLEDVWRQEVSSLRADLAEMRTSLATARHELAEEKRSRQRDAGDFSHLLQRLRQWTETQVCSIEKRLPTNPTCLIQKKASSSSGSSEDACTSTSMSEANEAFDTKLQNLMTRLDEGGKIQMLGSMEAQMQKDCPPPVACPSSARTNVAEASACPEVQKESFCRMPTKITDTASSPKSQMIANDMQHQWPKVKSMLGCREEIRLLEAGSPTSLGAGSAHQVQRAAAWHPLQSVR